MATPEDRTPRNLEPRELKVDDPVDAPDGILRHPIKDGGVPLNYEVARGRVKTCLGGDPPVPCHDEHLGHA